MTIRAVEFFEAEEEFSAEFARGHPIRWDEAAEIASLLNGAVDTSRLRVELHFQVAGFIEDSIRRFCQPIDNEVLKTLRRVSARDSSALDGSCAGAVIVRSTLEALHRPPTNAVETLKESERLIRTATDLKNGMHRSRGRQHDSAADEVLLWLDGLGDSANLSRGLGSNETIHRTEPTRVQIATKVLKLAAMRGCCVLDERTENPSRWPELSADAVSKASKYFEDWSQKDARAFAGAIRAARARQESSGDSGLGWRVKVE
jgi:hypothetical protein